jgi:hypothetical protein
MGLLDATGRAIRAVLVFVNTICVLALFLLSWPVRLLLSLLGMPASGGRLLPRPPVSVLETPEQAAAPNWLDLLQTLAFWVVAVAAVGFVIWSYLRDHPEIRQAFTASALFRALRALWRALRGQWTRWRAAVRSRLRRQASGEGDLARRGMARRSWFGVRTPRERVLYHYLGVLRRAKRRGFPRQPPETPDEYEGALAPKLPDARDEMDLITDAFVEARYSQHPVEREQVARVRDWGQRIKAALREVRLGRRSGGRRAGRSR